jgi:hypothetical protein
MARHLNWCQRLGRDPGAPAFVGRSGSLPSGARDACSSSRAGVSGVPAETPASARLRAPCAGLRHGLQRGRADALGGSGLTP